MTNKELVERYPFLLEPYYADHPEEEIKSTYLDDIPPGWKKAFGEQLCEELLQDLIENGLLDQYGIDEVKEKYGSLRWYDYGGSGKWYEEILPKYEDLSYRTCAICGKPATCYSSGWIWPYCDECAAKNPGSYVPILNKL